MKSLSRTPVILERTLLYPLCHQLKEKVERLSKKEGKMTAFITWVKNEKLASRPKSGVHLIKNVKRIWALPNAYILCLKYKRQTEKDQVQFQPGRRLCRQNGLTRPEIVPSLWIFRFWKVEDKNAPNRSAQKLRELNRTCCLQ